MEEVHIDLSLILSPLLKPIQEDQSISVSLWAVNKSLTAAPNLQFWGFPSEKTY